MKMLNGLIVIAGMLAAAGAVPTASAGDYSPPPFDGRVGRIHFHNDSPYPVTVTLWHPDDGNVYGQWTIAGGATSVLCKDDDNPVRVGSDWGLQLGDSDIRPLSKVSEWHRPVFDTSVNLFFGQ